MTQWLVHHWASVGVNSLGTFRVQTPVGSKLLWPAAGSNPQTRISGASNVVQGYLVGNQKKKKIFKKEKVK